MTRFIQTRRIIEQDLDDLNHVNNVAYLQFLQDLATAHWNHLASEEIQKTVKWVVRKHEIEYLSPAKLGDEIELVTWVNSAEGVSSERCYEIYLHGKLIVRAKTLWIAVDPTYHKPNRITATVKALFQLK